jgi:hypothetical protein
MKQFSILLIFVGFALSAFAQDVPFRKMGLYTKKTATWCGPCGSWGWDLDKEIVDRTSGRAFISMKLHESSSSRLHTPDAIEFGALMGSSSGVPNFYANQANRTGSVPGGISPTLTRSNVFRTIDSTGAAIADIGTVFTTSIDPTTDEISVYLKTEVLQEITGEYYVAAYVVEDDVIEYQESRGPNAIHQNVFRAYITPTVTGNLVASGTTDRGTIVVDTLNWIVPLDYDPRKIKVFVVVWKQEANGFVFENAWSDKQYITTVTSVDEELDVLAGASVFSRDDMLRYRLSLNEFNGQDLQVDLLNINGQTVKAIYNGTANTGIETEVSTADLAKGVYLVRTQLNGQVKTLKVIL